MSWGVQLIMKGKGWNQNNEWNSINVDQDKCYVGVFQ